MKNNSKCAVNHDNVLVNDSTSQNLEKSHKDWYNRATLGKQRSKPKYAPPKTKKIKKDWK